MRKVISQLLLLSFVVGVGLGFMLCLAINEKPKIPVIEQNVVGIFVDNPCDAPHEIECPKPENIEVVYCIDWGNKNCRLVKIEGLFVKDEAIVFGLRSDGVVVWRNEKP